MCGRYALTSSVERLVEFFRLAVVPPQLMPRYNVAPTQEAPVVRLDRDGAERHLDLLRWGLVPWWASDPGIGSRMINARSETAARSPAFREALSRRRCLVPADAFYEWKAIDGGKQPYAIRMRDGTPFALAGLWSRWREKPPEGSVSEPRVIDSFAILTTTPNDVVRELHDRMPVVIAPDDFARWMDPELRDAPAVASLLTPAAAELFDTYPVSRRVNDPANDDAGCMEHADAAPPASSDDEATAQGTLFD